MLLAAPLAWAGEWAPPLFNDDLKAEVPAVSTAALVIPDYAFSGQTDIEALIESAVKASDSSIDVAIYGFTLPRVADALVDARRRGVAVRVIVNETHVFTPRPSDQIQQLIDNGVNMRVLRGVGRYGIMHNKIGIFDGKLVLAGSFNWAVTANTANSENAVFSRDEALAAGYIKYFDWMWGFSRAVTDGPAAPVDNYGLPPEDPARPVTFNGMLLPGYTFSPGGRTEADIVGAVNFARETADIAVFSFYSVDIASAVVNAQKRGVKVRVVVDRVQASQSEVGKILFDNGIPFRWSQGFSGKGVMHNKFAVLDGKLLMTGSFNWSANAQDNNFENMFYTNSPVYTGPFAAQFENIFSKAYAPAAEEINQAARCAPAVSGALE
ncbi:MAG: hypothetical protein A2081_01150 [Elusimicrobia bacterium GWC2_61_19]|nr:MAG: hypothetical protein A2081_01150 [Elusimicrobia bacterium GWC2_61_19]